MRRVLLASPIPTHPQDQGNSARIFSIGKQLQAAGIQVHFLYYQMEGLLPQQRRDMEQCWDYLHAVPCTPRPMEATGDGFFMIDDWWEDAVGLVAEDLHKRFHFDAVIANYVWFSKILDFFGPDVLKIIDTHDVFGGRAEKFLSAGMTPEWFYTSLEQEAVALMRADIVLAIQDEEAVHFRDLGHPDVRVIGHLLPLASRAPGRRGGGDLVVGYLASGNPLNVHSLKQMQTHLATKSVPGVRFVVAGSICGKLAEPIPPFEILGRVDSLDDFYDRIDVVVNPMDFGTGLKIKSVEAVFQGVPLLATISAMVGLPVMHPLHALSSPGAVAAVFHGGALDLESLNAASAACARQYAADVCTAMAGLVSAVEDHAQVRAPVRARLPQT